MQREGRQRIGILHRLRQLERPKIQLGLVLPLAVILTIVSWAAFPGLFAPMDPYAQELSNNYASPGTLGHFLGTDSLGRDILSRIIHGSRPTLIVALSSLLVSLLIGVVVGLVAGLKGGLVESFLMRTADTVLSLPMILMALFLVILLGPRMMNIVIAIGVLAWAEYARVIRGETLVLREKDFVAYARVTGASSVRIMYSHLLPNVISTVLVLGTFQIGWVVLMEASLSFLGAGIPAPTPAWGAMIADGRSVLTSAWWVSFFPGLTIVLLVTSLNMLGDHLRDRWDPKLRSLIGGA